MKGLFIALEGPDGSGKSTITKLIKEELENRHIDFLVTREPGGTPIGEEIREIILDNKNTAMGDETEALLYAAARSQHVHQKIRPAIEQGKLVICDRFLLSSLAYQGIGRELGVEEVKSINDFGTKRLRPDLVLFFHVDPELTLRRKTLGNAGDRLEVLGNNFHNKVYNGYMELIKRYPEDTIIIDASKTIDEVFKDAMFQIDKLIEEGSR